MKPFDLAKALAGAPVITRNGEYAVTEFHVFKTAIPQVSLTAVLGGEPRTFTVEGFANPSKNISRFDLLMKSTTKIVNGFEIEAGENEPLKHEQLYYVPITGSKNFSIALHWLDKDDEHCRLLERGLVHLTKENAVVHAKAMLGIDPKEGEEA